MLIRVEIFSIFLKTFLGRKPVGSSDDRAITKRKVPRTFSKKGRDIQAEYIGLFSA